MGRYLIVTADDFGLTPGVNRGILEAHARGIVTSASLMAVGAAFEDAVMRARSFPRLGIGVHLTWVDERPVSTPDRIPTLVDAEGRLHRISHFLGRLHAGGIRWEEVERETRAQLERVMAAGIRPTHVDSHKHLHVYPPLLELVVRLLAEYGVDAVRLPLERPPFSLERGRWRVRPRAVVVSALAWWGRRKLVERGIFFADHFFGLAHTGALTESVLRSLLAHLPEGVSEVICHPGVEDEALRRTRTRLRSSRERELRALLSPALKEEIRRREIHLVTYGEVASRRGSRSHV